jgi:hypothetical protein
MHMSLSNYRVRNSYTYYRAHIGRHQRPRLGGLEVDHKVEFGRLYDRQISWLVALEDAAGVEADLSI